jgi:membrane associated rhomboid family serine protease
MTESFEEEGAPSGFVATPRRRANIATLLLLVFFLVLYGVMFALSKGWRMSLWDLLWKPFDLELLKQFGGLVILSPVKEFESWRFVTGAFVHVNLIHFLINCYCIFSLGRAVESYYGTRRMFVSFVACSVVANIFVVAGSPVPAIQIGTLGGLFGLDGMVLGFALRNRSEIPSKTFRWMLGSALLWPVFWVILSWKVEAFRGGIWGLIAGFGAGAVLGLAFEAAVFRRRMKPSGVVTFLFAVALGACVVSWASLVSATAPAGTAQGQRTGLANLKLGVYVCEEGGFEVPVPSGKEVTEGDGKLEIGDRRGTFCRIAWQDAQGADQPYELAWRVRSDLNLRGYRLAAEPTYPVIGGEEAACFVMSKDVRGKTRLHAQAILIHREKIYTIIFGYHAKDELAHGLAGKILEEFRFTDQPGR